MSDVDEEPHGLLDGRPGWHQRAACRGHDPALFYPVERHPNTTPLDICSTCPVRTDCLDQALTTPEYFGIWGGLTEDERHLLRRPLKLPPPLPPINHGTRGGANAHRRRGEAPCPACADAHRRYQQTNRPSRAHA